jgi:hypothetical protein
MMVGPRPALTNVRRVTLLWQTGVTERGYPEIRAAWRRALELTAVPAAA